LKEKIDHIFTKSEVLQEFQDVLGYYYLATTIDKNQKSQALVRVLDKVFKYAEKKQWPQKAVIFTRISPHSRSPREIVRKCWI